jgi:hypothetical protein
MLKVEQVVIKKFKILEDFDEMIKGHNILLMGDNGVGKSSFIQFIEIALGRSNNIPEGAEGSGHVVTTKDGKKYTFHVELKKDKKVVTIEGPDGLKDKRKGTLSSLIGAMDFDINDFVNLSKTEAGRTKQLKIFKDTFLDADTVKEIDRMNADLKTKFDSRTEINKDLKTLGVKEKSHPLTNDINLEKYLPVDIKKVYKSLQDAQAKNTKIKEAETRDLERIKRITQRTDQIAKLEAELQDMKTLQAQEQETHKQAQQFFKDNPLAEVSDFESQINDATKINSQHQQAQELKKIRSDIERVTEEAGEATVQIELIRQAISDTIKDIGVPIPGLSFDENNLLYNITGEPGKEVIVSPDTLSTSEIMELGVRLKMAENPDLGVLFLQHGESLGEKRFKEIMELANKSGWQVIMEQVQRGTGTLKVEIIEE